MADIASDLASSLEPRVVIQRVLKRSLDYLGADRATLSSVRGEMGVVHGTFGRDGQTTWEGRTFQVSILQQQPVVARALAQLGPAVGTSPVPEAADPEFREALQEVRFMAAIPLVEEGRIFGLLVLNRYEDKPFTDSQLPGLAAVGRGAALALRHAEAYTDLESARNEAHALAGRLRAAVTAAEDIAAQGSPEEAVNSLLSRATIAAAADTAAFAHLDGDEFVLEAATTPVVAGSRYPIDAETRARLMAGTTVHVRPSPPAEAAEGAATATVYEHLAVVPLLIGGAVVGIVVLARERDEPFEEDDITAVKHFGTLGALLVENSKLRRAAATAGLASG